MKQLLFVALLATGFSLNVACSADTTVVGDLSPQETARLSVQNADADAKKAIARGDLRLLAVYGLTTELPGTDLDAMKLPAKYKLRMLEGTSDAIKSPADRLLNENARKYAAKYNRIILAAQAGK